MACIIALVALSWFLPPRYMNGTKLDGKAVVSQTAAATLMGGLGEVSDFMLVLIC